MWAVEHKALEIKASLNKILNSDCVQHATQPIQLGNLREGGVTSLHSLPEEWTPEEYLETSWTRNNSGWLA